MNRPNPLVAVGTLLFAISLPWIVQTAADDAGQPAGKTTAKSPAVAEAEASRNIPPGTALSPLISLGEDGDETAIRKKLRTPLKLAFVETPLNEAIASIAKQSGLQFWINREKIADEGVDLEKSPVTFQTTIRLESALDAILEPLELDWIIDDVQAEIITITTIVDAGEKLETRVYPVGHLLAHCEVNELVNMMWAIEKVRWDEVGGAGSFRPFGESLVIRQTRKMHTAIESLLVDLEAAFAEQSRDIAKREDITVKRYHVGDSGAEECAAAIQALVAPTTWKSSGGKGDIRALKDSLLVSQTPRVHAQIRRIIAKLPPRAATPGQGGGMF